MYRGLMVVNAFLRTTKFDDIYMTLLSAAHGEGMELEVRANAELSAIVDTPAFDSTAFDFVLFWDKDVHCRKALAKGDRGDGPGRVCADARQLEQRGLRLFNSPQSILWCDDKALTYLRLKQAGIPLPRTILAPKTFSTVGYTTLAFVQEAANSLGFPVVLKECFGSFGQQVYLFHDVDALREKVRSLAGTPLLFQELVHESYGRDARLNVVGGRVVASILRRSTDGDFRSNLSRGGAMAPYSPTPVESALAIRAWILRAWTCSLARTAPFCARSTPTRISKPRWNVPA